MTIPISRISVALAAAALPVVFSGCALFSPSGPEYSRSRAFIRYWPQPRGDSSLRLAVKDMIDVRGVKTTGGSEYLAWTAKPALRDAACLAGARKAGAWVIGKTNLGELGVGVSGVNDHFGTPLNPVRPDLRLVPGGSSSGSASAVAGGFADVALGTDTAGSIRIPAACCGIAGLKTSFGLIPLEGVMPLSMHLDTVGPMALDVEGLRKGMELLQPGFQGIYRRAAARLGSGRNIKVGRLRVPGTHPAIERAIDAALQQVGFRVVPMGRDFMVKWDEAQDAGRTVAAVEAWMHYREFQKYWGVSRLTKAALRLGALNYGQPYETALSRRDDWQRELKRVFRNVDFIVTPTLQQIPPRISRFGRSALLELRVFDIQNTVAVNLAGNPALALPIPMDHDVVPVTSLQLVGPMKSEAGLLHAGHLIERALRSSKSPRS